jgi:hypothetical protein
MATEPVSESSALAYVLGLLAGQRDNPDSSPVMVAAARMAIGGLLPRAHELGLEIDEAYWRMLEER